MTRSMALRAFCIFAFVTALAGWASQVEIAEVLFLIAGSLSALMLFFAVATAPSQSLVPVRVRRRH